MNSTLHSVSQTRVESTEIILQSDLNSMGFLFGGRLVSLIDKIAGVSALKHARSRVATISIDHLVFRKPVCAGSIVTVKACINRVFKTSMEVGVIAVSLPFGSMEEEHVCSAYLTFVALDANGNSTSVAQVVPETDEEKRRFEQAGIRRENRLALQTHLGKN